MESNKLTQEQIHDLKLLKSLNKNYKDIITDMRDKFVKHTAEAGETKLGNEFNDLTNQLQKQIDIYTLRGNQIELIINNYKK